MTKKQRIAFFLILLITGVFFWPNLSWAANSAASYNQEGVKYYSQNSFAEAIEAFKKALALKSDSQEIKKNLSHAYAGLGSELIKKERFTEAIENIKTAIDYYSEDDSLYFALGYALYKEQSYYDAIGAFKRAIDINKNNAKAHEFLGQVYYLQDRMELAIYSWEDSLSINPNNSALKERLEKVKKEHNVEEYLNKASSSNFIIKYDGEKRPELGSQILDALEDGHYKICYDLEAYPKNEVVVILYTKKQFQDVTHVHSWVGGIYDGKIRLPIGGINEVTPRIKALLYHELTHAIIYSLLKKNCPTWLNEGLAQYEEGLDENRFDDILRNAVKSDQLIPLKRLEGSFLGFDSATASLAYAESLSAVAYIINYYNIYDIQRIIKHLAEGKDLNNIFKEVLLLDYNSFHEKWKDYLTSKYYN